jgi:ribonuclease HIII
MTSKMDEQPSPLNKGEIMQSNQHTELIQAMLDQELSPPQQHMLDQFQQKNNDLASIRDDLEGLQLCFQTKWEQSTPPPSDPQAALKRLKRP